MGKGPCREFIFLFTNHSFELGQSKISVSVDDLGDWKSKFAGAKETFLVRRDVLAHGRFLNWSLLGNDRHENSSRAGDCKSCGTLTCYLLLIKGTIEIT